MGTLAPETDWIRQETESLSGIAAGSVAARAGRTERAVAGDVDGAGGQSAQAAPATDPDKKTGRTGRTRRHAGDDLGGSAKGQGRSLKAVEQTGLAQYPPTDRKTPPNGWNDKDILGFKRLGRRQLAHIAETLGVDVQVWPGKAAITRAAQRVSGGRTRFLEYVTVAVQDRNPTAMQWWSVWSKLRPTQQDTVSFDDVCAASNVPPSAFLGMIVETGVRHEAETADMVAASVTPQIVRQMGKSALRIGGDFADVAQRDRLAFLQSRRFLPVPRNASMSVTVNANSNASASAKAAAASAAEPSMPSFLSDVGSLQAAKESVVREITGEVVDGE